MKDIRTRKPLSNSKVSKLLLEDHNISICYKTIGKIIEDMEMEKRIWEKPSMAQEWSNHLIRNVMASVDSKDIHPTSQSKLSDDETRKVALLESEHEKDSSSESELPNYPELDLDSVPTVFFVDDFAEPVHFSVRDSRIGMAGKGDWLPAPAHVTEELGKRAEKWVYEAEKKRLLQDGYNPSELEELGEFVWISHDKPSANYDIRSIYRTQEGEERTVYIEVKGTAGTDRTIRMSRGEFELALSLGQDYWLVWVPNVTTERPGPSICYRNFTEWVAEGRIRLQLDKVAITLPDPILQKEEIEDA